MTCMRSMVTVIVPLGKTFYMVILYYIYNSCRGIELFQYEKRVVIITEYMYLFVNNLYSILHFDDHCLRNILSVLVIDICKSQILE